MIGTSRTIRSTALTGTLTALAAMRGAIDRQRDHDRAAERQRVEAIRAVAERLRSSYEEELRDLTARVEACLLPVDPLRPVAVEYLRNHDELEAARELFLGERNKLLDRFGKVMIEAFKQQRPGDRRARP